MNTVPPDATASAQREAILTISCSTGWQDPQDEARSLAWVRQFYRDLFADTVACPCPVGSATVPSSTTPALISTVGSGEALITGIVAAEDFSSFFIF